MKEEIKVGDIVKFGFSSADIIEEDEENFYLRKLKVIMPEYEIVKYAKNGMPKLIKIK